MDLWHTDWYQHSPDEWWLVYEDDASRLVTGVAVDCTPTMDVSMGAFDSVVAGETRRCGVAGQRSMSGPPS